MNAIEKILERASGITESGESLNGEEKPGFLMEILKKGELLEHLRQTVLGKE